MELENIVANTVYLKAREGESGTSLSASLFLLHYHFSPFIYQLRKSFFFLIFLVSSSPILSCILSSSSILP